MTPQSPGGNAAMPQTQRHTISLPLTGVDRRYGSLHRPQGSMWDAENAWFRYQTLEPRPSFTPVVRDTTKQSWSQDVGEDEFVGDIGLYPNGFLLLTNERVQDISGLPSTQILSLFTLAGTCTFTNGSATVSGSGTAFTQEGLALGSAISAPNGVFYNVLSVTNDTTLTLTTNYTGVTGGHSALAASVFLMPPRFNNTKHQLRFVNVAGTLVLCGIRATYYLKNNAGTYTLRALNRIYRGNSILALAGRPVITNVLEATSEYAIGGIQYPLRLRFPTRGDVTDWTGYGSGFLDLLDDGTSIEEVHTFTNRGFAFTKRNIHELISTGQSASNPIASNYLDIPKYTYPRSNVVTGTRGMYYWSHRGLEVFDGRNLDNISVKLGRVPTWESQTIRLFYNPILEAVYVSDIADVDNCFIYYEKEDAVVFPASLPFGTAYGEYSNYFYELLPREITTSTTVVMRRQDANGQLKADGTTNSAFFHWKGITMKEGVEVYKSIDRIKLRYEGNGEITIELGEQGESLTTITFTPSTSSDIATHFQEGFVVREAPIFEMKLTIPYSMKIHELTLEYTVGGDVQQ